MDWCYGVGFQRRQVVIVAVVGHLYVAGKGASAQKARKAFASVALVQDAWGAALQPLCAQLRATGSWRRAPRRSEPSIEAVRLVLLLAALTIASAREALAPELLAVLFTLVLACMHIREPRRGSL